MAGIENWLISWTCCCTNTKDPKQIKWQKVETILEHVSGDFLVRFIAYCGHFWHVRLKHQQIHFIEAIGALEKKNHVLFVRKGLEMVLLSFSCTSIGWIGLVWNWLKTCNELIRQRYELWQFWRFWSRKYRKPFQSRIVTNEHPCHMYGTKVYQWTKYGRNWILGCVRNFFDLYWHLLLTEKHYYWRT